MSVTKTIVVPGRQTFRPVPLTNGQCKGDHLHFRGAAREIYKYLRLLAQNHGGFIFASVENITAHTKNWKDQPFTYSTRQCKRILKMFRTLRILGERTTREVHGRIYHGWQFAEHNFWAETQGDICEFKRWLEYEDSFQSFSKQNVTQDVTEDVTQDVTELGKDVTQDVTQPSDIVVAKTVAGKSLQALAVS